jgi:hypothetical protein
MSSKKNRNISGLLQYAAAIKDGTEEKVNNAIDTLKRSKTKKINFKTVSELSGVSTTTLYNNPILRERISSLRAVKKSTQESALPDTLARVCNRELELRQEIKKIKEDKQMLIVQLVEMEQLRIENQRLKNLLSQKQLE